MPDGARPQKSESQDPRISADVYKQMVREIGEYAVFMLDTDNLTASWNRGVERILGYSESEFIGQPCAMLFTPEDREKGEPAKEADIAADTGQAADDRWHLKKDGSRFWANGVMTSLHDQSGELTGFVKVMRDNTREKQADEALQQAKDALERRVIERTQNLVATNEELRKSQARFAAAFQSGPFAAVLTSPEEDRFTEVNDAFCRLTGYSKEEVIGRTAFELDMWVSPEDQQKLHEAMKDGTGFRDLNLSLTTKTGDTRIVLMSAALIPDGPAVLLKMFYDITDRQRTEEQLINAIEEVMQDTTWFSQALVEKLTHVRSGRTDAPMMTELTTREHQLLALIAKGMNNQRIAEELGLSLQTVRNYTGSIYGKLGVHSRAEAVVWARERGLT